MKVGVVAVAVVLALLGFAGKNVSSSTSRIPSTAGRALGPSMPRDANSVKA
jgi:hypothetical protein